MEPQDTTVSEENTDVGGEGQQASSAESRAETSDAQKRVDLTKKARDKELGERFYTQNSGNITTQNVFNIASLLGDISLIQRETSSSTAADNNRKYKLYEHEDCADFVAEYKLSLHLACAITAAMFEYVPVSDLENLTKSFLCRFTENEYDSNGNEKNYLSQFIPLNSIVDTLGAQTCMVTFTSGNEEVTERCICFGEKQITIMKNLWELFPMMRTEITSWLIETDFSHSYRNAFNISCFAKALFNIIKIDYGDSINRLFPQLVVQEENKYLIIRLMLLLAQDKETKNSACEILKRWANSNSWLWEISLIVYALANEDLPISNSLEKTLCRRLMESFKKDWEDWNFYFTGGQMIKSLRLRNLVANILNNLASDSSRKTYIAANIYLLLVFNAYQFIDKKDIALPLVAFDNKKQIVHTEKILHTISLDFTLRHSLFEVLEVYLKEINEYGVSPDLLKRLECFFYVIAKRSIRTYGDIQRFLSQLQHGRNEIAKEILMFLQEKIPQDRRLLIK